MRIRSAGWQNEIDKNIGINGQCLTLASTVLNIKIKIIVFYHSI
ncbi:MAG: hypothetical protein ACR5LA_11200 [Wolbachia sp.]